MENLKYRSYNYFSSNFKLVKSSQGWFRLANPFDFRRDQSMGVNFDGNIVLCHRTGYKSDIIGFIAEYEGLTRREVPVFLVNNYEESVYKTYETPKHLKVAVRYPESFYSLSADCMACERARSYVAGRGMDIDYLNLMGFGTCLTGPYVGYLIIPFKVDGDLKYYIGRDFLGRPAALRYQNPPVAEVGIGKGDLFFNQDALSMYDRVFLLEGWSDAITIGRNAISSQGWSLTSNQKSILIQSGLKELVIIPDKGFYEKALLTAWDLSEHMQVRVVCLDYMEGGKDVNEIGRDTVMKEIDRTGIFYEGMLKNIC